MKRLDFTGIAYLVALLLGVVAAWKLYQGGQAAVAAVSDALGRAGDAIHTAIVEPVTQARDAVTTAVLDKIITEPPNVANINSPVIAPPPRAQWIGSEFFPSGQFVGDLEDATGFYSSPYALHRDRVGANDLNAPGS